MWPPGEGSNQQNNDNNEQNQSHFHLLLPQARRIVLVRANFLLLFALHPAFSVFKPLALYYFFSSSGGVFPGLAPAGAVVPGLAPPGLVAAGA